jgi:hypothetical protein
MQKQEQMLTRIHTEQQQVAFAVAVRFSLTERRKGTSFEIP